MMVKSLSSGKPLPHWNICESDTKMFPDPALAVLDWWAQGSGTTTQDFPFNHLPSLKSNDTPTLMYKVVTSGISRPHGSVSYFQVTWE